MQKTIVTVISLVLLLCCNKQKEQQSVSNGSFFESEITISNNTTILAENETTITVDRNYQEYINDYDSKAVKLFEIEGNFTNSGNRELIVFYQRKSTLFVEGEKRDDISFMYCFILDQKNEKDN